MNWIKSKIGENTYYLKENKKLSSRFHVQVNCMGFGVEKAELIINDLGSENVYTNRFHEGMYESVEEAKKKAEEILKPFV